MNREMSENASMDHSRVQSRRKLATSTNSKVADSKQNKKSFSQNKVKTMFHNRNSQVEKLSSCTLVSQEIQFTKKKSDRVLGKRHSLSQFDTEDDIIGTKRGNTATTSNDKSNLYDTLATATSTSMRYGLYECAPEYKERDLPCDVENIDTNKAFFSEVKSLASTYHMSPSSIASSATYDPSYAASIDSMMRDRECNCVIADPDRILKVEGRPVRGGTFQTNITTYMREQLLNFITKVGRKEINLGPRAMHLSIQLVDLCLCHLVISKDQLFLLGSTCMLIAGKVDEVEYPTPDIVLSTLDGMNYRKETLIEFEAAILKLLSFEVVLPTRLDFIQRFARAGKLEGKEMSLALYLVDLSLQDFRLGRFKQSMIAASAVHLTKQICRPIHEELWTPTLIFYTGYEEIDLLDCIQELCFIHNHHFHTPAFEAFDNEATHNVSSSICPLSMNDLRYDNKLIN
jgi:hypothetical protein